MNLAIQPDEEVLNAWTPEESEDLFGESQPSEVIARLR